MMKIMQSTIEKGLYIILLLNFIFFGIAASYAYRNNQALKAQQQAFHTENIENQKIIVADIKDYIACLLTINPNQAQAQIQQAEEICFSKVPQVKN